MAKKGRRSKRERRRQHAADRPNRAAMSLVAANSAAPVNLAAALNVLSDNPLANANAGQTAPIQPGIGAPPAPWPGPPRRPTTPGSSGYAGKTQASLAFS